MDNIEQFSQCLAENYWLRGVLYVEKVELRISREQRKTGNGLEFNIRNCEHSGVSSEIGILRGRQLDIVVI